MRPAKKFPAIREHFGETSTLELSFSRLIFAMRYQKLSPRLNYARMRPSAVIQQLINCCVIITT